MLDNDPLTSLSFFASLNHQHYPPYYTITGIHYKPGLAKDVDNGETEIKILGHNDATCSEAGRASLRLSSPGLDDVETSDGRTDSEQIEHEESLTIQQADEGRADKWGAEEDQGDGGDEDDSDIPAQRVRSWVVGLSLLH
jgi:hypothetical protein